ncbi:DNA cytosine methyltransferase [Herbiconiux daphne]|uniref:DNA cytosine methyltransferase n=1 Tax=Herbiconiux daphne TaxID=2970914 RepID=A0ABT2HAN3_9MICO|nr:DNA cytosine methyltransferase [Herbiconiux daphne]MCS5736932.1 DNA cytosine methyltransferase [Herbiconiux daphne]
MGAATQALKQMGQDHEVIDYVELDKYAVKSYNAINGTDFKPTDINDVDVNKYGEIDLLIAG